MSDTLKDEFADNFGKYLAKTLAASTVTTTGIVLGMATAGYIITVVKKFNKKREDMKNPHLSD